jgi:extracellular elastinolytic metalloproteinase
MQGHVHSGIVFGTANIVTPRDDQQPGPMMTTGVFVDSANVSRHTALDSSVIFHEFTHGVTSRLVGGPLDNNSLASPQSDGMSEGWSDYIACTVNDANVVGAWVENDPAGFRRHLYNDSYPNRFGDLGTAPDFTADLPHNIGRSGPPRCWRSTARRTRTSSPSWWSTR